MKPYRYCLIGIITVILVISHPIISIATVPPTVISAISAIATTPTATIASPTIASPTIASPTIASPTIASPTIAQQIRQAQQQYDAGNFAARPNYGSKPSPNRPPSPIKSASTTTSPSSTKISISGIKPRMRSPKPNSS
ncbi:MAG: hypothetical protein HC805_04330 [Alkalinema sp. RL_2_19]|nr:hypothetical protein [Alkalinema sp. RL_2_19]